MSVAKVAVGWGVLNAVVGRRGGRMVMLPYMQWYNNATLSSHGYDGSVYPLTDYRAQSDAFNDAIVYWLTGKASGASILLQRYVNPLQGGAFNTQFQGGWTRSGHTYDLTGNEYWNGYDPTDYDCVFVGSKSTLTSPTIDTYLEEGGAVCTHVGQDEYTAYGVENGGNCQKPFPSGWLYTNVAPFINNPQSYFTSMGQKFFAATTQTKPGVTTRYFNTEFSESQIALWQGPST